MSVRTRRSVCLVALLGPLACAGRRAAPADTLRAYADAVERRDPRAAHALLSAALRRRVSPADLKQRMDADPAELAADARSLRANAERWATRVEVTLPTSERVALVWQEGAWRLDTVPLDPYGHATPAAALATFVRAVESRRYDVLLRLIPERQRAGMTTDLLRAFWEGAEAPRQRALLRELRQALETPIEEEGDEAFMTYGSRQLHFVRESGLWRIERP